MYSCYRKKKIKLLEQKWFLRRNWLWAFAKQRECKLINDISVFTKIFPSNQLRNFGVYLRWNYLEQAYGTWINYVTGATRTKETYRVERVLPQPPSLEGDSLCNKGTIIFAENHCVVIIGLLGRCFHCNKSTVISVKKTKNKREVM